MLSSILTSPLKAMADQSFSTSSTSTSTSQHTSQQQQNEFDATQFTVINVKSCGLKASNGPYVLSPSSSPHPCYVHRSSQFLITTNPNTNPKTWSLYKNTSFTQLDKTKKRPKKRKYEHHETSYDPSSPLYSSSSPSSPWSVCSSSPNPPPSLTFQTSTSAPNPSKKQKPLPKISPQTSSYLTSITELSSPSNIPSPVNYVSNKGVELLHQPAYVYVHCTRAPER